MKAAYFYPKSVGNSSKKTPQQTKMDGNTQVCNALTEVSCNIRDNTQEQCKSNFSAARQTTMKRTHFDQNVFVDAAEPDILQASKQKENHLLHKCKPCNVRLHRIDDPSICRDNEKKIEKTVEMDLDLDLDMSIHSIPPSEISFPSDVENGDCEIHPDLGDLLNNVGCTMVGPSPSTSQSPALQDDAYRLVDLDSINSTRIKGPLETYLLKNESYFKFLLNDNNPVKSGTCTSYMDYKGWDEKGPEHNAFLDCKVAFSDDDLENTASVLLTFLTKESDVGLGGRQILFVTDCCIDCYRKSHFRSSPITPDAQMTPIVQGNSSLEIVYPADSSSEIETSDGPSSSGSMLTIMGSDNSESEDISEDETDLIVVEQREEATDDSPYPAKNYKGDMEHPDDFGDGWSWVENDTNNASYSEFTGWSGLITAGNMPSDFFDALFDHRMFGIIAYESNLYAEQRRSGKF